MARIGTTGFETGDSLVDINAANISGGAYETTIVRTGARSLKGCLAAGGGATSVGVSPTVANGTNAYLRVYVYFDALTATNQFGFAGTATGAAAAIATVGLKTDGTIGLFDATNAQIGSGFTPVAAQWYRIELRTLLNAAPTTSNGTTELRIDGQTIASSTAANLGTTAIGFAYVGKSSAVIAGVNGYFDDVAVNDSTGGSQTSWPNEGAIVMMLPTADSARGANWTGGAGGTTNLWDAVNNEPPVGVVLASATNTSQIKNAASDTAQVYDATMQSYNTAAGSGKIDSVTLVQAVASIADSTGSVTLGAQVVSNPAIAETTAITAASAAGTHPTNWTRLAGTISYAPAVTLSTAPVCRVRKGSAGNFSGMFDFVGLLVEYVPAYYARGHNVGVTTQAITRAALWMRRHTRRLLSWLWTPANHAQRSLGRRTANF